MQSDNIWCVNEIKEEFYGESADAKCSIDSGNPGVS